MGGTSWGSLTPCLGELKEVLILSGESPRSSPSSQGWNILPCGEGQGEDKAYLPFPRERDRQAPSHLAPLEAKGVLAVGEDCRSVRRERGLGKGSIDKQAEPSELPEGPLGGAGSGS